jgi:hypothetical protein
MEENLQPAWLAMNSARLERHLREHKYPVPLMRDIMQAVKLAKARQRKTRIKDTVVHQLWDDILSSARMELGGVRTMKSQAKRQADAEFRNAVTVAKYTALSAYEDVLVDVIAGLVKVQKQDKLAPGQFVSHAKEHRGWDIPNNGEHWSDYVDAEDKRHVRSLFEAVPDPIRGKRKAPFERRVSPNVHVIQRAFLVGQMKKAQDDIDLERSIATDPDYIAELAVREMDLQRAYIAMDNLKPTSPLPARWTGLLNM